MDPIRFMPDESLALLWHAYTLSDSTERLAAVNDEIDRRERQRQLVAQV